MKTLIMTPKIEEIMESDLSYDLREEKFGEEKTWIAAKFWIGKQMEELANDIYLDFNGMQKKMHFINNSDAMKYIQSKI